jgi:hypothetical protein
MDGGETLSNQRNGYIFGRFVGLRYVQTSDKPARLIDGFELSFSVSLQVLSDVTPSTLISETEVHLTG